jgi:hypothetical protein
MVGVYQTYNFLSKLLIIAFSAAPHVAVEHCSAGTPVPTKQASLKAPLQVL